MASSEEYVDQDELEARLGPATMTLLFDDDGSGVDAAMVTALIVGASARTTSWVRNNYTGTLPFADGEIPGMIRELALTFACAMAWERNPDADRAMNFKSERFYKQADAMGERLAKAILRMVDATAPTPANVGGYVNSGDPDEEELQPRFFGHNGQTGIF